MDKPRVILSIDMENDEVDFFESLSETENFEVRGKQFKGNRTIVSVSPIGTDTFPEYWQAFVSHLICEHKEKAKYIADCFSKPLSTKRDNRIIKEGASY